MRTLYKDKLGNRIVEREDKGIGLQNAEGIFTRQSDFKEFIKEHNLKKDIKFMKGGDLWISNKLLKYG